MPPGMLRAPRLDVRLPAVGHPYARMEQRAHQFACCSSCRAVRAMFGRLGGTEFLTASRLIANLLLLKCHPLICYERFRNNKSLRSTQRFRIKDVENKHRFRFRKKSLIFSNSKQVISQLCVEVARTGQNMMELNSKSIFKKILLCAKMAGS